MVGHDGETPGVVGRGVCPTPTPGLLLKADNTAPVMYIWGGEHLGGAGEGHTIGTRGWGQGVAGMDSWGGGEDIWGVARARG